MTRMRSLTLALTLGVGLCLPQLALAQSSGTVTLSGTVAAGSHTYTLEVRDIDGTTVIGSRPSGPHVGGTTATAVAAPLAGAYDPNLSGAVAGAVLTLTDTTSRYFRSYVKVDAGAFTEITVGTPVTLQGITFTTTALLGASVPTLSPLGVLILILVIASGALLTLRRRRSGRMEV